MYSASTATNTSRRRLQTRQLQLQLKLDLNSVLGLEIHIRWNSHRLCAVTAMWRRLSAVRRNSGVLAYTRSRRLFAELLQFRTTFCCRSRMSRIHRHSYAHTKRTWTVAKRHLNTCNINCRYFVDHRIGVAWEMLSLAHCDSVSAKRKIRQHIFRLKHWKMEKNSPIAFADWPHRRATVPSSASTIRCPFWWPIRWAHATTTTAHSSAPNSIPIDCCKIWKIRKLLHPDRRSYPTSLVHSLQSQN